MLKIDNTLLQEVGLGTLPDTEKNSFLRHVYETLEMRVGIRLADQMSNEQLDEFERYFEAKDDAGAFKWLETNFPNYKDIVQQEFDKLKAEVAQSAPQILAASQAQAAAVPAGGTPQVQSPVAVGSPAPAIEVPPAPPQPATPPQPPIAAPAPPPVAPPQPFMPDPATPPAAPAQTPAPAQPYADPAASVPPAAPPQSQQPFSSPSPFPPQQPPAGPGPQ
jgi:hypothetical protein